jgi:hypothetical protein
VIQIGQGSLDSRVAPRAIGHCHLSDQRPNLGADGWSPRTTTETSVVLLYDQSSVPGQQRVRGHNRNEISGNTASKSLGSYRQSSPLRVGEPQTLRTELFPQDAVLVLQILDDVTLLSVHLPGERNEQELQWLRRQRDMVSRLPEVGRQRLVCRGLSLLSHNKRSVGLDRVFCQYRLGATTDFHHGLRAGATELRLMTARPVRMRSTAIPTRGLARCEQWASGCRSRAHPGSSAGPRTIRVRDGLGAPATTRRQAPHQSTTMHRPRRKHLRGIRDDRPANDRSWWDRQCRSR